MLLNPGYILPQNAYTLKHRPFFRNAGPFLSRFPAKKSHTESGDLKPDRDYLNDTLRFISGLTPQSRCLEGSVPDLQCLRLSLPYCAFLRLIGTAFVGLVWRTKGKSKRKIKCKLQLFIGAHVSPWNAGRV